MELPFLSLIFHVLTICKDQVAPPLELKSKSTLCSGWVWPRRVTLKHVSTFCWLNPTFVKRTIFCIARLHYCFQPPSLLRIKTQWLKITKNVSFCIETSEASFLAKYQEMFPQRNRNFKVLSNKKIGDESQKSRK